MILDTLMGYKSNFAFTADNTTVRQSIAAAGIPGADAIFYPAAQVNRFQARDNFIIESAMLAAPHGYKWGGETPLSYMVNVGLPTGVFRPLNEFGTDGVMYFQDFNQWIDVDFTVKFADYWTDTNQWIRLEFDIINGTASQPGMPAGLNTQVIRVVPVLKVRHNIRLGSYV